MCWCFIHYWIEKCTVKQWYSLCSFLHSPVTPFLLGPNILLSTLFSNINITTSVWKLPSEEELCPQVCRFVPRIHFFYHPPKKLKNVFECCNKYDYDFAQFSYWMKNFRTWNLFLSSCVNFPSLSDKLERAGFVSDCFGYDCVGLSVPEGPNWALHVGWREEICCP